MYDTTCAECGMTGPPTEYHPYAACLMFKQCHDSYTVRANLRAVLHHGAEIERYARLVVALNGDMPTEKPSSTVEPSHER